MRRLREGGVPLPASAESAADAGVDGAATAEAPTADFGGPGAAEPTPAAELPAPADELSAPAGDDVPAATVRRGRRAALPVRGWLLAGVLAVVVALMAAVAVQGIRLHTAAATAQARTDSVDTARKAAKDLVSYNWQTLDQDFARAVVLVFLDVVSTNKQRPVPRIDQNRVRLTMVHRSGRWLIDDVQTV